MSPELIGLLDKISFTGALLMAVYILYRDSRGDTVQRQQKNTEAIAALITQVSELATQTTHVSAQTDRLAVLIEQLILAVPQITERPQLIPNRPLYGVATKPSPSSYDRGIMPGNEPTGSEVRPALPVEPPAPRV